MPAYHFISGLPRSGSTLLAALLRQNPDVFAGMTGPVGAVVHAARNAMGSANEASVFMTDDHRARILRAIFDAYYADQQDKAVIFDTNRSWTARLPAIARLFPDAKVICCVRSVAWIMDSLERLIRDQPFNESRLFTSDSERSNVYTRVDALAQPDRFVGYAWSALKEAVYGESADRLLLIDFDLLTAAPQKVLDLVYRFVGMDRYVHDTEAVAFDAPAFDAWIGLSGLHRVKPQVRPIRRRTILPPDLFQRLDALSFWQDLKDSRAHIITAQPAPSPAVV